MRPRRRLSVTFSDVMLEERSSKKFTVVHCQKSLTGCFRTLKMIAWGVAKTKVSIHTDNTITLALFLCLPRLRDEKGSLMLMYLNKVTDQPAWRLWSTHLSMLRTTRSKEDKMYPPVLIIMRPLHSRLPAYHCKSLSLSVFILLSLTPMKSLQKASMGMVIYEVMVSARVR